LTLGWHPSNSATSSTKIQKFFHCEFGLSEDALQNGSWQIKMVVPRKGDSEVRFLRVPQLNMASGLMIEFETGSSQRAQDLTRF